MNNKFRKIAAVTAGAVLALSLTGCIGENVEYSQGDTYEFTATLNDGSVVPCIRISGMYGFDCNYDKATRPNSSPTP